MKVSNSEELVLILINICLKIRAESIEYFFSCFIVTILKMYIFI